MEKDRTIVRFALVLSAAVPADAGFDSTREGDDEDDDDDDEDDDEGRVAA